MSTPPDAGRVRWGRPSVVAAMRELLDAADWLTVGRETEVILHLRRRPSVATREWWLLSWIGPDGDVQRVESQYVDVLLRRAAEVLAAADAAGVAQEVP